MGEEKKKPKTAKSDRESKLPLKISHRSQKKGKKEQECKHHEEESVEW